MSRTREVVCGRPFRGRQTTCRERSGSRTPVDFCGVIGQEPPENARRRIDGRIDLAAGVLSRRERGRRGRVVPLNSHIRHLSSTARRTTGREVAFG
jgi:hypothetical protein